MRLASLTLTIATIARRGHSTAAPFGISASVLLPPTPCAEPPCLPSSASNKQHHASSTTTVEARRFLLYPAQRSLNNSSSPDNDALYLDKPAANSPANSQQPSQQPTAQPTANSPANSTALQQHHLLTTHPRRHDMYMYMNMLPWPDTQHNGAPACLSCRLDLRFRQYNRRRRVPTVTSTKSLSRSPYSRLKQRNAKFLISRRHGCQE
jgi:hypothetical protein